MIGFLRGKVHSVREDRCLLDVNGVGYNVLMSVKNLSEIKKDTDVFIYTYTVVREDAMFLCGFLQQQEYDLFINLISVSGIGAKGALAVLASISVQDFILAIQTQDLKALTAISGVGKKTAERLILELKSKFADLSVDSSIVLNNVTVQGDVNTVKDVSLALQALGYDAGRSLALARAIYTPELSVEQCIKLCLKELMQG